MCQLSIISVRFECRITEGDRSGRNRFCALEELELGEQGGYKTKYGVTSNLCMSLSLFQFRTVEELAEGGATGSDGAPCGIRGIRRMCCAGSVVPSTDIGNQRGMMFELFIHVADG